MCGQTGSMSENSVGPVVADVVVEIPRGSRNKYEVDDHGTVRLDRRVHGPVAFPADYGYIPGTCGPDGDALDAVVLLNEPAYPGVLVRTRLVGAFRLEIGEQTEDKVVGAAVSDPSYDDLAELDDLPTSARDEIAVFFEMYRRLEKGGTPKVARSLGAQETSDVFAQASRHYNQEHADPRGH